MGCATCARHVGQRSIFEDEIAPPVLQRSCVLRKVANAHRKVESWSEVFQVFMGLCSWFPA
eukprot:4964904-Lingulodinium_polyedra.AAC.1